METLWQKENQDFGAGFSKLMAEVAANAEQAWDMSFEDGVVILPALLAGLVVGVFAGDRKQVRDVAIGSSVGLVAISLAITGESWGVVAGPSFLVGMITGMSLAREIHAE